MVEYLLFIFICIVAILVDSGHALHLDEDLYNRALAHAGTLERHGNNRITERLQQGEVEALYEVAKSMNDSGDKLSSVLIWHALADDGSEGNDYESYDEAEGYDYTGHVPSAISLGFSYYEVDKPRSLHYFLMATSKKGAPHQSAMYNAGRLYLELEDPSGGLAYIRACATLDNEHPMHARPQMSITCQKAYDALSTMLLMNQQDNELGLEEAVECFPYADMEDFPLANTKEFQIYHGAMQHLEKYAESAQKVEDVSDMGKGECKRAAKHLTSAIETLMNFKSSYRDDMSKLQLYLMGYIIERISILATELENRRDGLLYALP